jgi:hypothetical protein
MINREHIGGIQKEETVTAALVILHVDHARTTWTTPSDQLVARNGSVCSDRYNFRRIWASAFFGNISRPSASSRSISSISTRQPFLGGG